MDITIGLLKPDHPIYTVAARKGWRGYTRSVTALATLHPAHAAALIKRAVPHLSRAQHQALARLHAMRAARHERAYQLALDVAAQETFGRDFGFFDYRISTIGCEEFTDAAKERLRFHRRRSQQHADLADAHFSASGMRLQTALAARRAITCTLNAVGH